MNIAYLRENRKKVLTGILLFVFVFALIVKLNSRDRILGNIPSSRVMRGELLIIQTESGDVRAAKNIVITAVSRAVGALQVIDMIDEGTVVNKGDIIVQFDTEAVEDFVKNRRDGLITREENLEKLEASQASIMEDLNADLKTIKNNYELAELQLESIKYESDTKKQEVQLQYDNAKLNYDSQLEQIVNQKIINRVNRNNALIQVEEAKNDLNWAEEQLEKLTVKAPGPGLVVYKEIWKMGIFQKIKIGDNVFPRQALVELPDMSEIQVRLKVNEIDVDKYNMGQEVAVTLDAYPEKTFTGKVTEISPLVEGFVENLRLFNVIITLEERNNPVIRPGMTARCEIVLKKAPESLYVPVEAVFERNGKAVIFKKGSGFKETEVEVGDRKSISFPINATSQISRV